MDRDEKKYVGKKVRLNLKYYLHKNNMTEDDLIKELNVSKDAFLNAKYPDKKTPTLIKIATYFNCEVDKFMNEVLAFPLWLRCIVTEDGKDEFLRHHIKEIKAGRNKWIKIDTIDEICKNYKNIYNKKMFRLDDPNGSLYLLLGVEKCKNRNLYDGCKYLTYDTFVEYFTLLHDNSYDKAMEYCDTDYKEKMLADQVLIALNDSMTKWEDRAEYEVYEKEKSEEGYGIKIEIDYEDIYLRVLAAIDDKYSIVTYKRKNPKECFVDEDISPESIILERNYHILRNKGEREILECIEKNPYVTRKELAEVTGYSVDTIKKKIQELRERSVIYRTDNTKNGCWIIN